VLKVSNLAKSFQDSRQSEASRVQAVRDVSFQVERGELFTLLGPSGCGKTTTLRCIAGLERPDEGEIVIDGRVVVSSAKRLFVPANDRGLGMVFQSYAIWPHMTVFQNTAYPFRVQKRSKRPARSFIRQRVEEVLDAVGLGALAGRQATDLSGGQQQRLALARALVTQPVLLLLDEPLSNLDAKLRESMRFELKRLQRDLGVTTIYVTHDQIEALALSTRIAVMKDGGIEQIDSPEETYRRPGSSFVAEFIGNSNVVGGTVEAPDRIASAAGPVRLETQHPHGTQVLLIVRPEDIEMSNRDLDVRGDVAAAWDGVVESRAFLGDSVGHVVKVGDVEVLVRTARRESRNPGSEVRLFVASDAFHALARD